MGNVFASVLSRDEPIAEGTNMNDSILKRRNMGEILESSIFDDHSH